MSQAPMNIVGPPDDADVQRALRFVLANGRQFDSTARMDSLDVLRTRCADADVRHAVLRRCAIGSLSRSAHQGSPGVARF